MSGFVGALLEAWDELRIHKMRVLLSLFGVAVSVAAMTGVAALLTTSDQIQREMMEQDNGRQGSVTVWLPSSGQDSLAGMREANEEFERFILTNEIRFASRNTWSQATFTGTGLATYSELMVVDHPYAVMRRLAPIEGSWFVSNTDHSLAPQIVVNQAFLRETNTAGNAVPFTAEMTVGEGQVKNTVVVIGVVPDRWQWEGSRAYILNSSYLGVLDRAAKPGVRIDVGESQLEMWVGPDLVHEAEQAANAAFGSKGGSAQIQDYSWIEESSRIMGLIGFTITGLVLGLAALNLLTISMVTLRGRIREIGIRRAFGATSGRIFFAIMMESVVATVLAGAVGVAIAAFAFSTLPISEWLMGMQLQDAVPFPVGAGVLGLLVAAGVGALAGLIPALVAVRVRPIDAIRF